MNHVQILTANQLKTFEKKIFKLDMKGLDIEPSDLKNAHDKIRQ